MTEDRGRKTEDGEQDIRKTGNQGQVIRKAGFQVKEQKAEEGGRTMGEYRILNIEQGTPK